MVSPDCGIIGCVCRSEATLNAALAELLNRGIAADDIRIGAAQPERAQTAAQRSGVRADVHPEDPLQGLGGLDHEGSAREAVDRAGVLGGAIGAVAGLALSFTPVGGIIPVAHSAQTLANGLLFFVLGAIAGSVLGAAFAPQLSTHAGFRLIDGMQEGGFALIVQAPRARLDDLQKILETAGGNGITRL